MKKERTARQLFRRLPLLNLVGRPFRTFALVLMTTLLAFALFGGSVLTASLQNGLSRMEDRFGADLIVVPLGYDAGMEAILLKGEPCYFYLERSCLDRIAQIEGVEQLSAQFYLTSTSSDCCDLPVQLIGFEPDSDFSIQPWIRENYSGSLTSGMLLVGSDIETDGAGPLIFFGQEYPVAAQLEKTGTGLDNAVYADMETLYGMMEAARDKGFHFLENADPNSLISSILIKTAADYDADTVGRNIRSALDGLQIIKIQNMVSGISAGLGYISTLLYGIGGMLFFLTLAILALVFSVTANERKKEFAVLRLLGAARKQLARLILTEALCLSGAGGVLGVTLSALTVFPFSIAISQSLGMPYLLPPPGAVLKLLLSSLAVTFAIGPLAAAYSAWRISHGDTSMLLREGR